jgi:SAM-dependent methyltransferase
MDLRGIYARRFGSDLEYRRAMWRILCRDVFQPLVRREGTVLEIGAGYCEFINQIQAAERMALDPNPDMRQYAAAGVQTMIGGISRLSRLRRDSIDTVFASNLLEHLDREEIVKTIRLVKRILKPDGSFIILQPNIRFCGDDYWMFFDHVTPIDDRALAEVLETNGFILRRVVERFLPFTTQGPFPKAVWLIEWYLRLPIAWRLFGQQSLILCGKSDRR